MSFTHGMYLHALYNTWKCIRQRTTNPNSPDYPGYGAKGVRMLPAWEKDAELFIRYVERNLGPKPTASHTIDRIDNLKGYIPGNIRWATPKQQSRNCRGSTWITLGGERRTLAEWSERSGLGHSVIQKRLKMGWDHFRVLSTKVNREFSRRGAST
jgi:hypothetical protein